MNAPISEPQMSAGHVDWFLAITRTNGVRRRIEREGLTRDVADALQETLADLAKAAVTIDQERLATVAAIRGATDL